MGTVTASSYSYFVTVQEEKNCIGYIVKITESEIYCTGYIVTVTEAGKVLVTLRYRLSLLVLS